MSRRWKGRSHTCMIGKCTSEAEYVWYNPLKFKGAKWKICEPCYHMLKGEKK